MIDLKRLSETTNFNEVEFCENRIHYRYQDRWSEKGHCINVGLMSPDHRYFYVNISKNNSSFTKKVLTKLGWQYQSLEDYQGDLQPTYLVVLRDPVSRWISGITEYLFMYHIDTLDAQGLYCPELGFDRLLGQPLALSMIFDRMTFDDHTEKQSVFLLGVDLHQVTWFDAEHQYTKNLTDFLSSIGYAVDLSDLPSENADSDFESQYNFHSKRKALKTFLQKYLGIYPELTDKIQHHFACDYHLMDCVKFYGS